MGEEHTGQILESRRALADRAPEMFRDLVDQVDWPDVEIRAYARSVPLSISPLIVANRDVVLADDHRGFERPDAGIVLRSRQIIDWADRYVDQLHLGAPFVLRDLQGPSKQGFDDLRRAMETS